MKRKGDGLATGPKIFKAGPMPEDISFEAIPLGVRTDWFSTFYSTTPSCARELLCISEAIRYFESEGRINHIRAIPKELYESSLDILLVRGN